MQYNQIDALRLILCSYCIALNMEYLTWRRYVGHSMRPSTQDSQCGALDAELLIWCARLYALDAGYFTSDLMRCKIPGGQCLRNKGSLMHCSWCRMLGER